MWNICKLYNQAHENYLVISFTINSWHSASFSAENMLYSVGFCVGIKQKAVFAQLNFLHSWGETESQADLGLDLAYRRCWALGLFILLIPPLTPVTCMKYLYEGKPVSEHTNRSMHRCSNRKTITKYVGCSESKASYLFPWKLQQLQRARWHKLFDRANSQLQNTVFQHSRHHEQCIFPRDEREPTCHSCTDLQQWKWPIVTTAETHHLPPHYAHTHCSTSVNVQRVLMNVSGCHRFHVEEFSSIPLLHVHSPIGCCFARLALCCHQSHSIKMWHWCTFGAALIFHTAVPRQASSGTYAWKLCESKWFF